MSEKLPHAVDDGKFEAEPVYLSDLSKCTPSSSYPKTEEEDTGTL